MAEGFEWLALAEQEWVAALFREAGLDLESAETPEGYTASDDAERTTPTLEEIDCLRIARKKLEGRRATKQTLKCGDERDLRQRQYPA